MDKFPKHFIRIFAYKRNYQNLRFMRFTAFFLDVPALMRYTILQVISEVITGMQYS